jgi:anionic cell wall polymer biosynthesis LytR-Cps2A-Psr (LCP) family protein
MRRQLIWYCIIATSVIIIVGVSLSIYKINTIIVVPHQPAPSINTPTPTPSPDPDREFSILLLGYGGAGHDGGTLTDSIVLANFRPHEQRISLISIPRDLWVELPLGTSTPTFSKINSAFPFGNDDKKYPNKPPEFTGSAGGGQMAKSIVSQVTGKPIDYFVALDFAGFIKVVDQLGGIDLKITKPFEDKYYPIDVGTTDTCGKSSEEITALSATMSGDKLDQQFTCRYELLKFNIGATHIDGTTALKFSRSRHSEYDGGDFNRSNRQRQVILAVKDKVISLNILNKILPILNTLSYHVRTDIPFAKIEELIARGLDYSKYEISSVSLNDKNVLKQDFINKQSVLVPTGGPGKFDEIKQFISNQQSPEQ